VVAALMVPATTVLALWLWLARSRAGAAARGADEPGESGDMAELTRTISVVQERLAELSGRIEIMHREWHERDRRLTVRLNALLALTERPGRIDLSIRAKRGARRPLDT
jgi:hypothetical protein